MSKKGILLILDVYGEGEKGEFNAVDNAKTPFLKHLKTLSHSLLKTDGEAVGLFEGDMGGSEVGHTTIGAGRVILGRAKEIQTDIDSGNFVNNKQFKQVLKGLKDNGGNLHLVGLMSDKNVHSNINHALAIIDAANAEVNHIFLHIITDGRDCGITESLNYLAQVQERIKNYKNCEIASVCGRVFAMDRENNLERTENAFKAMFKAEGGITAKQLPNYLKEQHLMGNTDEFVQPISIKTSVNHKVAENDYVWFFNFREDRLRQIVTMASKELPSTIVTMANVDVAKTLVIYPSSVVKNTLSEYLSKLGKTQVKISESTKYAHVTYFLNGGEEKPFKGEDRIHIPTEKLEKFDAKPKMQAKKITSNTIKAVKSGYDAVIVNFSNADMIGHTGNYLAAVKSLEYLDGCVKKIAQVAKKYGYFMIVTADHGNSETMRTKTGQPHTAHTLNKVFCVILDETEHKMKPEGELKDVAPTFMDLMQEKPNKHFTGKSLII